MLSEHVIVLATMLNVWTRIQAQIFIYFMDLGLSRITRLVRNHHPKLPWKAVHIAGTNGKGTVAACSAALFHRKGFNVGRFTSPHLIHRHDCITLNEKTVDKGLFTETEELVKQRDRDAEIGATSFELLTATAYEIFAKEKVDIAVVECGLGGRLDATNILESDEVLCSVITSISLDHQAQLGETVEEIALEKAGIVKSGVPLVFISGFEGPKRTIKQRASEFGSEIPSSQYTGTHPLIKHLHGLQANDRKPLQQGPMTALLIYEASVQRFRDLQPNSFAPETVSTADMTYVWRALRDGWKGRMQDVSIENLTGRRTSVLVDGAHNRAAMKRLVSYVVARASATPVTWVVAASDSKALKMLFPSDQVRSQDSYVVTDFGPVDGMPWARPQPPSVLRDHLVNCTKAAEVHIAASPLDALQMASNITAEKDLLVVAGSLYLVGDVLRHLEEAAVREVALRAIDLSAD